VFRDTTIRVEVQELTTQVQESGVTMTFDGEPVTPQFSRNGSTLTVTYDPPGLLDIGRSYPFSVTVADNATPPSSQTVSGTLVPHYLPASPSGMFLIEAEDFNTGGGNVEAAANTMPYLGNAYVWSLGSGEAPITCEWLTPVADNAGVYRSAELAPPVPMGANFDDRRQRSGSACLTPCPSDGRGAERDMADGRELRPRLVRPGSLVQLHAEHPQQHLPDLGSHVL
jgi:hypothetical protein